METDCERLLAELQEKEEKLLQAAGYGKALLDKIAQLEKELEVEQEKSARLEEALQSKQLAFLKSLSESKAVSQQHISELEVELEACHRNLELDKTAANTAREELQRSHRLVAEENEALKNHLAQVKENHTLEMQHLKNRMQEIENLKGIISGDYNQTRRSLQQLQDENQTMEQDLSYMYRSNEKLSTELEGTKTAADFWEDKYHDQEQLLKSRGRELDETRKLLKELQLELDQRYLPEAKTFHGSASSSVSLYDELSLADDIDQANSADLSTFDDCEEYPYMSDDEKVSTLRPRHRPCAPVPSNYETDERREADHMCERCQELEARGKEREGELEGINQMLLLAVQQKLKLQQQIECWESDMAHVLESHVSRKLAEQNEHLDEHQADQKCSTKAHSLPGGLPIHFIRLF